MTGEQFYVIQQYLLLAYWPFIRLWIMFFLAGSVLAAVLLVFLVVARELISTRGVI